MRRKVIQWYCLMIAIAIGGLSGLSRTAALVCLSFLKISDSSYSFCLGYLPAEHIETPTERLARLNKHRNIDV